MEWVMLALAGILKVTWACAMKCSNGFTKIE
jgi:multidrug transporter EmrE-like cation transporter